MIEILIKTPIDVIGVAMAVGNINQKQKIRRDATGARSRGNGVKLGWGDGGCVCLQAPSNKKNG